jgi:hypothetical protein
MENTEYIKKLEELKKKNESKIDNFKLINKQINLNIESLKLDLQKYESDLQFIKSIESTLKQHFFELCVSLKI